MDKQQDEALPISNQLRELLHDWTCAHIAADLIDRQHAEITSLRAELEVLKTQEPIAWEPLQENDLERIQFDRAVLSLGDGDVRAAMATMLRMWSRQHAGGSFGMTMAIMANEVAKLYTHPAPSEAKVPHRVREVLAEIARATKKFPTWPTDPLHALAVLGEEFGELTKAVLQRTYEPHKSTLEDVRSEAVQTAAMAIRFLASLNAYEYTRGVQHTQPTTASDCD